MLVKFWRIPASKENQNQSSQPKTYYFLQRACVYSRMHAQKQAMKLH